MVATDSPFRTPENPVRAPREKPGSINRGPPGAGSPARLATAGLERMNVLPNSVPSAGAAAGGAA